MSTFVISSTHFGAKNAYGKYGYPKTYERYIWNALDERLDRGDVLIHLGDFAERDFVIWSHALISCLGQSAAVIMCLGHEEQRSATWFMKNRWSMACDRTVIDIGGKKCLFSHNPMEAKVDMAFCAHPGSVDRPDRYVYDLRKEMFLPVCVEDVLGLERKPFDEEILDDWKNSGLKITGADGKRLN